MLSPTTWRVPERSSGCSGDLREAARGIVSSGCLTPDSGWLITYPLSSPALSDRTMYWGAFSFPPIAVAGPPRGAGSLSPSSLKPRGQPGGGVRTNPRNSYLVPCGISWGTLGLQWVTEQKRQRDSRRWEEGVAYTIGKYRIQVQISSYF